MSPHHIGVVINFSSNEARFLSHCLEEVEAFADQMVVPVCDHFFDGVPEDAEKLGAIFAAHPKIHFVQFPFSQKSFYGNHSSPFWHNLSRLVGLSQIGDEIEYMLFLDVDEIVEGRRFAKWLSNFPYREYAAVRLACYWYFRKACWRSERIEDSPLLIRRAAITYDGLMHVGERRQLFRSAQGKKMELVCKEAPLFHHYSWVRTRDEMLRKVLSWGHRGERDWEELVRREFGSSFSGREFVHGARLHEVKPYLRERVYAGGAKGEPSALLSACELNRLDVSFKLGLV